MRSGEHKVARAYVLYRAERTEQSSDCAPRWCVLSLWPCADSVRLANVERRRPLDEVKILQREVSDGLP